MKPPIITTILVWTLVAFFLIGSFGNAFVSREIAAEYAHWGYPSWFHLVTAAFELLTAVSVAYRPARLYGLGFGILVMMAAAGTVILHGEFGHAVAPMVVGSLCLLTAWRVARDRSRNMTEGRSYGTDG